MDVAAVERIAKAVLYEGYMLYPYRPSAIKNRQRFNFGVLHPQCHNLAQAGLEPWTIQTECLAGAGEGGTLQVRLRFLQIVDRTVARVAAPIREFRSETVLQPVDSLEIDGRVFQPWQEAAEQEVALPNFNLADIAANPCSERFQFPATTELEALCDRSGQVCGAVVRRKNELRGSVRVSATQLSDRIFRISLSVDNQSDCAPVAPRAEALLASLVSAHFVLGMEGGEFISLVDPPDDARQFVATCRNSGLWPILVGEPGRHDTILCSPIILDDYPQIAPESPGDLFDGAEIDEILSLRILTLTDEEKREMRQSDERARQVLERTESLPPEQWMKLHGAFRDLHPAKEKTR